MNTFAVKEKRSSSVLRNRSQLSRFGYRSQEVKAQQTEIQHILFPTGAQAKLIIGQPCDKYEQEADRVADQVMKMSGINVAQRVESGQVQSMHIQRMCPECEDEQLQPTTQAGQTPEVGSCNEPRINSLSNGGQQLDSATRSFFESRFGHDFSDVRVHTDSAAVDTAKSIHAHAFTLGNHVVIGSEKYQLGSQAGQRLLAHELTHVIQQSVPGTGSGDTQLVRRQEKAPEEAPTEPTAPESVEAAQVKAEAGPSKTLSGKDWVKEFTPSSSLGDLSVGFKLKVEGFVKMLADHSVTYHEVTTKRPIERQYLMYYCLQISEGSIKAKNVPAQEGVNINWVHETEEKSKTAATEMKEAYGLGKNVAKPKASNHSEGNAIDMKFDFSSLNKEKNLTYKAAGGKDVERTIKTDDEARKGVKAADKSIANIKDRELSKAGADFGVKRALDNDIVHWSTTGK